jgi:hypothetical protein
MEVRLSAMARLTSGRFTGSYDTEPITEVTA